MIVVMPRDVRKQIMVIPIVFFYFALKWFTTYFIFLKFLNLIVITNMWISLALMTKTKNRRKSFSAKFSSSPFGAWEILSKHFPISYT